MAAIDDVHYPISAADLMPSGALDAPLRPAASRTLATDLGAQFGVRDMLQGMYRDTNQLITEVARGSVQQHLTQFTTASLPSGSMTVGTTGINTKDIVGPICQNAALATIASYDGALSATTMDTISDLCDTSLASALYGNLEADLRAWQASLAESLARDVSLALFDDAALSAEGLVITGLRELESLWSEVPDSVSRLLGSAAWTVGDPFNLISWLPAASSHALIPPSLYESYRPERGTLFADLLLLGDANGDPEDQAAAVHRMADRISWYPRKASVKRALAEQAGREEISVNAVRHRELSAAVVLVFGEKRRAAAHRFAREWVTDDQGHKVAVPPTNLPMEYFWAWLCREVPKAAEASVLGRPYPPVAGEAMDRIKDGVWLCRSLEAAQLDPVDPETDPLAMLLKTERHTTVDHRLLAVLRTATPKQRQILVLLAGGVSEAEAARRLGLAPSTVRNQVSRLRRKVM